MGNPFCSRENGRPFCYPKNFFDNIIILIMPPLYAFIHEYRMGFEEPMNILKNLILTCLFYIPGFIHAMHLNSRMVYE